MGNQGITDKCHIQINYFRRRADGPKKFKRMGSKIITVHDATLEEVRSVIVDALVAQSKKEQNIEN